MASASSVPGRRRGNRLPLLPIISILMLLGAIALFVFELLDFSRQQDRLGASVSIGGVEVGGLLPGEAVAAWESTFSRPLTLWYEGSPILLEPASIGFRVNNAAMLAEARTASSGGTANWMRFFYGLIGEELRNTVNIELSATWQNSLLEQLLREIALRYDRPPDDGSWDLESLTIETGAGGRTLDIAQALPIVGEALLSADQRDVVLPLVDTQPGPIHLGILEDLIRTWLDSQGFIYDGQTTLASVYIADLQNGQEIGLNADVAVSAASTVKLPIMLDYYRSLNLAPTDDEAWLMANSLLCSNNASSNLIMQIIGGGENIFRGLLSVTDNAQHLGARNTFITAPFDLGVEGQLLGSNVPPVTSPNARFNTDPDPYNQTTAEDLGALLGMVYDCAYLGSGLLAARPDGEYTRNECRQMIELMSGNDLLRLLQGGLPPGTRIAHKNGWLENLHGDAGIVFPPNGHNYIVAVFVWEDSEFFSYERAWPLIEGISRAAWNYFSPEQAMMTPRQDLPQTGAAECEGPDGFLPPYGQVNLNDIDAWRG
ncbi:MAG: serine hydrolase [Anaerolineaceae bacterium]|nr:serine hydrolase [Anaerolineaceae bacterium]